MMLQCVSVALVALLVVAEARPQSYPNQFVYPISNGLLAPPKPYYPSYPQVGYNQNPSAGYYFDQRVNQGSSFGNSNPSIEQGLSSQSTIGRDRTAVPFSVNPGKPAEINYQIPLVKDRRPPSPLTDRPLNPRLPSPLTDKPLNVMLCFYYGNDNAKCAKTGKK